VGPCNQGRVEGGWVRLKDMNCSQVILVTSIVTCARAGGTARRLEASPSRASFGSVMIDSPGCRWTADTVMGTARLMRSVEPSSTHVPSQPDRMHANDSKPSVWSEDRGQPL